MTRRKSTALANRNLGSAASFVQTGHIRRDTPHNPSIARSTNKAIHLLHFFPCRPAVHDIPPQCVPQLGFASPSSRFSPSPSPTNFEPLSPNMVQGTAGAPRAAKPLALPVAGTTIQATMPPCRRTCTASVPAREQVRLAVPAGV